jgi:2,4-diaminopentanoate dehydrogenase
MIKQGRSKPYRVVQWATGTLGKESLRQIIDHPDLELAGVYVYSDAKAGKDAGEICGRPKTGVLASTRAADIISLDADFVLHMPMLEPTPESSDREIIALLESGKNVISVRGYYWPRWRGTEYEKQFLDACITGGATLHGNGICPGFVFDRIGPAMTSFCTRVTEVRFVEFFDLRLRPAHTIYDVIGLGRPPGAITLEDQMPRTLTTLYSEMYHLMAAQWDTTVKSVSLRLQWLPADNDIHIKAGLIPKGTSRATIWTWEIEMVNGLRVSQNSHWYVDDIPGWDRRNVWIVDVVGEPRIRAEMPLEAVGADALTPGGYDPNGKAIVALCINSMPEVAIAAPGILKPTIFAPWRARFP